MFNSKCTENAFGGRGKGSVMTRWGWIKGEGEKRGEGVGKRRGGREKEEEIGGEGAEEEGTGRTPNV